MGTLSSQVFSLLSPAVQQTIADSGIQTPTPPQTIAIPEIIGGKNVLLIAPTGSGKTEAVLLPILDRLLKTASRQGISIIYITPLRALNRDLLKRLEFWSKKLKAKPLEDSELDALSRARRSADLVLSYGRRAVVAQCVYGIGPQTASRILAKMHDDEKRFYKDLLEAKLKFITTRPFWDKP